MIFPKYDRTQPKLKALEKAVTDIINVLPQLRPRAGHGIGINESRDGCVIRSTAIPQPIPAPQIIQAAPSPPVAAVEKFGCWRVCKVTSSQPSTDYVGAVPGIYFINAQPWLTDRTGTWVKSFTDTTNIINACTLSDSFLVPTYGYASGKKGAYICFVHGQDAVNELTSDELMHDSSGDGGFGGLAAMAMLYRSRVIDLGWNPSAQNIINTSLRGRSYAFPIGEVTLDANGDVDIVSYDLPYLDINTYFMQF